MAGEPKYLGHFLLCRIPDRRSRESETGDICRASAVKAVEACLAVSLSKRRTKNGECENVSGMRQCRDTSPCQRFKGGFCSAGFREGGVNFSARGNIRMRASTCTSTRESTQTVHRDLSGTSPAGNSRIPDIVAAGIVHPTGENRHVGG